MKILVGGFVAESNARVKKTCALEDFMYTYGDDVSKALYVDDIFKAKGIEAIPTVYADGRAGGLVEKEAFDFIEKRILRGVREHLHEIDGIFLFLHGASHILELEGGSGEHSIIRNIRKITGPYLPIAMVMDPHGNLSSQQAENCTIIRTFRHSPHTDRRACHRLVARLLIELLENRRDIHPAYRKVPLLLGGERTVSTDEPMVSINRMLDEIEVDERIMCCSYHIGYVRHDNEKCGASAVVVPNREEDSAYAQEMADKIAAFAFSKRHEFHFTGIALEPEEAMEAALTFAGKPCFITDSGDNCTAGGPGCNTYILKQFLAHKKYHDKTILFACIADKYAVQQLMTVPLHTTITFTLGEELDMLSSKVSLEADIIAKGKLHHHYGVSEPIGDCVTVKLKGYPISIIIGEKAVSFAEEQQYIAANVNLHDYDLIIVKQGYLYPDLKKQAAYFVMSLSDGATNQRTEKIKYQTILRPIYPLDEI